MSISGESSALRCGGAWLTRVAFCLFAALLVAASNAQTPPGFDHSSTGYILQGAHVKVQCAGCHGPGVPTRGVPRECNTCHVQGGMRAATFKPPSHIPSIAPGQQCLDCHNQNSFAGAVMKHTSDMFGQCARCHNTVQATGKPITHMPTTASCDACHTTGRWTPPKSMVHDATTVGRCSTCHNGTIASGKPPAHIPTTAQCDTCHTSTVTWLNAIFLHDPSTVGRCSTCHNNQTALGRPAGHIPTNSQCDTCHTSYVSFTFVTMNHTGLNGQCSNCHNGAYVSQNAQTKISAHVPTTAQCDSSGCHSSTVTWATAVYAHNQPTDSSNCGTVCHVPGAQGLPKSNPHIPTSQVNCGTCHQMPPAGAHFKPATMNHVGTAGQCVICHSGAYVAMNAQTKPAIHIPTTRSCDACHLSGFVQFYPGTMDHSVGTAGQCSTCHSGAYLSENAQMKPTTHVTTSAQCDTCHNSTISWATAVYAHSDPTVTYIGNCSTCHKAGGPGLSKPTNHVPTSFQCDTCHTNFLAFKPAFMNHTGTNGQCSNCHNGSYIFAQADGQGVTHIPETRQCDTCHTSTIAWTSMSFLHPANAAGRCSQCHSGAYLTENAQMQPATHIPTAAQCDTCHSGYVSWATSAAPDHTTFVANCRNCHVPGASPGPQGLTQPTTHIPVGAVQCDQCHNKYPSQFKPATMKHTATGLTVAGVCINCHSGAYASVNALPQGATHIPTAAACDLCHSNTGYISWTSRVMSHAAGAIGTTSCATCHSGAYLTENAIAKGANHIPIGTVTCDKCHTAPPSGNTPDFTTRVMDHTQVYPATPCATCHSGAYVSENAQGQPVGHVPTSGQPCNNCHAGYVTWVTATFTHVAANQTQCGVTCHNNAATSTTTGIPKPANHLPVTITPCGVCHSTFPPVAGGFSLRPFMNHAAAGLPACLTCHTPAYAFTNANAQGATHIPTGTTNCGSCHTSTTDPTWTTRASSAVEHSFLTGSTCTTCHSGGFISENAATKGSTHIPTTAQCNVCHTDAAYLSWTVGSMNHAAVTGTLCGTCHTGAYVSENFSQGGALGKPVNHIPYQTSITGGSAMDCNACHSSTTLWTTEKMNHNNTPGNGSGGFCKTCHQTGNGYLGNQTTKAVTHQSKTATDCSQSGCHKPLGTKGTSFSSWT